MDHWEHKEFGVILCKVHNSLVGKGFALRYVHNEKECVGLEYSRFNKILMFQLAPTTNIFLIKGFIKKKSWSMKDEMNYDFIYDYNEFIDKVMNYLRNHKLI